MSNNSRFCVDELSEFLNNDSGGHRLAAFLQQKSVFNRPHGHIFVDHEPDRLSLNVCVEKLQTPPAAAAPADNQQPTKINTEQIRDTEELPALIPLPEDVNSVPHPENTYTVNNTGRNVPGSPVKVPTPSARFSARKSSRDSLRRRSIEQRSNLSSRRRTLFKDYESTLHSSNFSPPVCSTPKVLSKTQEKLPLAVEVTDANDNNVPASCSSLQQKENALQSKIAEMEKQIDEIRHTSAQCLNNASNQQLPNVSYVLQKSITGQVVLTPMNLSHQELLAPLDSSKPTTGPTLGANGIDKTIAMEKSQQLASESAAHSRVEIALKEIFGDDEIPETQDPVDLKPCKNTQISVVIRPDNQTVNEISIKTPASQPHRNTTEIVPQNVVPKVVSPPLSPELADKQKEWRDNADIMTDDSDDLDNGDAHHKAVGARVSGPLNLAPSEMKVTKVRRLRKRSHTRQRTYLGESQMGSTETESESGPPPAHPLNLRRDRVQGRASRRAVPLNKAPSIPINGELFADEIKKQLDRLTNYEIVDLRKRNSLGEIFQLPARKSKIRESEVLKKQLQLEEEIRTELSKRNLDANAEGLENVVPQCEDVEIQIPDAPPGFRDSSPANKTRSKTANVLGNMGVTENISNSPLFGDDINDNVTFIRPAKKSDSRSRGSRHQPKELPEIVKNYIEVSQKIGKHRKINQSKRSLYTKGNSDSETSTMQNETPMENRRLSRSTSSFRLPPRSPNSKGSPNVSQRRSSRIARESQILQNDELIPPPIEFFDQVILPNHTESVPTAVANVEQQQNDDFVFKKPQLPPSRSKNSRKRKVVAPDIVPENNLNADDTTLRRSKRGHIPLKTKNLFERMFLEQMEKSEKLKGTRLLKEKSMRSSRDYSPFPIASSTANSHLSQNTNSKSENKTRKQKKDASKTSKKLNVYSNFLGDTACSSSASSCIRSPPRRNLSPIYEPIEEIGINTATNVEAIPEKGKTKKKQTKTRSKRTQSNTTRTKEAQPDHSKGQGFEHRRLVVPPAPVSELNIMIDNLKKASEKNTREESESATTSANEEVTSGGSRSESNTTNATRTRKARVRIRRTRLPNCTSSHSSDMATDSSRIQKSPVKQKQSCNTELSTAQCSTNSMHTSNAELLSWLKGISDAQVFTNTDQIFKDMRCSAAGKLTFTDLEGIDYAFYDTDEKASLGYLRFKPRQVKQSKRAKKYHLHFVVLEGNFKFGTNNDNGIFATGDLVAINKDCRYTIENMSDSVGILMVVKK